MLIYEKMNFKNSAEFQNIDVVDNNNILLINNSL